MTRFYSDLLSADGVSRTEPSTLLTKRASEVDGAFLRYSRAFIDHSVGTLPLDSDMIRMVKFKSGVRLVEILASNRLGAVGGGNLRVTAATPNDDGTSDAFLDGAHYVGGPSAIAMNGTFLQTDILCLLDIPDVSRGMPIWQTIDLYSSNAGIYGGVDPLVDVVVVHRVAAGGDYTTGTQFAMECLSI